MRSGKRCGNVLPLLLTHHSSFPLLGLSGQNRTEGTRQCSVFLLDGTLSIHLLTLNILFVIGIQMLLMRTHTEDPYLYDFVIRFKKTLVDL